MGSSKIGKDKLRGYIRDLCINCHKLRKDYYDLYKNGHISDMIKIISDLLGEEPLKDADLKLSTTPSVISSNILFSFHYGCSNFSHILFLYTVIFKIQELCSNRDELSEKFIRTDELNHIYFFNSNFKIGDEIPTYEEDIVDNSQKRILKKNLYKDSLVTVGVYSNTKEFIKYLCGKNKNISPRIYEYIDIALRYGFIKKIDAHKKISRKDNNGTKYEYTQITTSRILDIVEDDGLIVEFIHFLRVFSFTEPLGFIGVRIFWYFKGILDKKYMPSNIFRQKNIFLTQTLDDDILAELLEAMHKGYVVEFKSFEIESYQQRTSPYPFKAIPLFITVSTRTGKRYGIFLDYETHDESDRIFYIRLDQISDVAILKNKDLFVKFSDLEFFKQQNIISLQDWKKYRSNLIKQKKSFGSRVSNIEKRHEVKITLKLKKDEKINEYLYVPNRLRREFASDLEFLYEVSEEQYNDTLPYTHIIRIIITDADELQSWLKTYIGRIIRIECDTHGFGNTVLQERYINDILKLCRMYNIPVDINNFNDTWNNGTNIDIGTNKNNQREFTNSLWKDKKNYYKKINNETFSLEYLVFITLICTKCKNMTLTQLKLYLKENEELYHFNASKVISNLHNEGALIFSYKRDLIENYIDPKNKDIFNDLINEYLDEKKYENQNDSDKYFNENYIPEDFLRRKIIECTNEENHLFKFASADDSVGENFIPSDDAFRMFSKNFTDEEKIIVNHPFCKNFKSIPFTDYDCRWLLSVLNHPRASMFIYPKVVEKLKDILKKEGIESLFNDEDFYYYDRDKYGECDVEYLSRKKILNSEINVLDNIRNYYYELMYKADLVAKERGCFPSVEGLMEITYDSYANNSGVTKVLVYPVKLEYDLHNDNTRIFGIKLEEVNLGSKYVYKPKFLQIVLKTILDINASVKAKDLLAISDKTIPLMTDEGYKEFKKIFDCISNDIIEPAMIMLKVDERKDFRSTLERFTLGISSYKCWNAKSPFEKDVQYLVIIFTWNDWLQIVNKILNSGANVEIVDFCEVKQKFEKLDKKHSSGQFKDEYKAFQTMINKNIEIIKNYYPDIFPLEYIQQKTSIIKNFIIGRIRRQIECMEQQK
ncbi:MAG: hypothetical protein ACI4V7_10395 [Succinivibrionaceae bacterium]